MMGGAWYDQVVGDKSQEEVGESEKQEGVFTLTELLLTRPGTHQSAAATIPEKTTMARRHNLQKTVTMQLPIQLVFSFRATQSPDSLIAGLDV